ENRVQNALDEGRILILGSQVLIGIELKTFFETGFGSLSPAARAVTLLSLAFLLGAFALAVAPATYHRIVTRGEDTEGLHAYASGAMDVALVPLALGLACNLFVCADRAYGRAWALAASAAGLGAALAAW